MFPESLFDIHKYQKFYYYHILSNNYAPNNYVASRITVYENQKWNRSPVRTSRETQRMAEIDEDKAKPSRFRHLFILLKKSLLIQSRHKTGTFFELFLPGTPGFSD